MAVLNLLFVVYYVPFFKTIIKCGRFYKAVTPSEASQPIFLAYCSVLAETGVKFYNNPSNMP
jgi:hypothetical protein